MRLLGLFVVGTLGFLAITYFEQLPILGWLGIAASIGAWIALARAAARSGGAPTARAAALGVWTGVVGAWSAWVFQTGNLFSASTPGLERVGAGFSFVGATLGLFYWPLVGAAVCAIAALTAPRGWRPRRI
jgi:hypothetical protein